MYNMKLKERRLNTRSRLTGILPGKIINKELDSIINCRPVDISEDGLGILTEQQLENGLILHLTSSELDIEMKVMWKKQDFGKANLLRYGLICSDTNINLEDIFQKAGCLK